MTTSTTSMTGKGDLRINGTPVSGEWELSIGRDYVDATTFGSVNKTYLAGAQIVDLDIKDWAGVTMASGSPYIPERPVFDYDAATEMYEDDPVVMQILKRMADIEGDLDRHKMTIAEQHAQMAHQQQKFNDARADYDHLRRENTAMREALYRTVPDPKQWAADDPVKNRNMGKNALKKRR